MSETTEKPKTDLELAKLSGPVKQLMQVTCKAHYRDGKVVQGNIETDYTTTYENELITYRKDGNMSRTERYTAYGVDINILNENIKIQDEIIHTDFKGNVRSRTVHTLTKHGQVRDAYCYNGDGSISYKVIKTLNDDELPLEEIQYQGPEERIINRTTHEYDDKGRMIKTSHYDVDGKLSMVYTNNYNEDGKTIETRSQMMKKGQEKFGHWHKSRFNEHGDCIETISLNNDGTVKETFKQTHEYDKEGKRIVPYHPPYDPHALKEGETCKEEKDAHGNWIKRTIFKNKIPALIISRSIVYYGENEDIELVHPIRTEEPGEIENTGRKPEELTEAEAMWLTEEPARNADNFALLRYYAQTYRMAPSVTTYTGPFIDALAVLKLLTETDKVQEIHTVSQMHTDGKEGLEKYTVVFPYYYGHMLQATQLTRSAASQFDLKSKDNINIENGYVHFSPFILLRPGKMDERDENSWFQDHLDSIFYKCTLKKLPNKPVIRMIEVEGGGFVMREHPVDDDFEIKDLDINYGYGFSEFNDELMQRMQQGTKGLILFHGQPGTGKTYYIRHLLRQMVVNRKVVIYMPPNMVDHLAEPGFMTFLMSNVRHYSNQGFFCVLLIEDAEPLLAKRQEGVRIQGVTNLLNMTDGLLNDMLNIQIMCTFNVDLKKLDSALLRPGRLIARKEFKPLSVLDANLLAQRLGIKHHFNEPVSLGEIYAMKKNRSILIHDVKSEEGASTGADDF